MIRNKRTYVFDLDNTLVKTDMANNLSYKEAIWNITGVDIKIKPNQRFTRNLLYDNFECLPKNTLNKIIDTKNSLFFNYIEKTILNNNLTQLLRILSENDNETILLTNSHKNRALRLCSYYNINNYFTQMFFLEDYTTNKYDHLETVGYDKTSVILFENEDSSKNEAISKGLHYNNIIKINF